MFATGGRRSNRPRTSTADAVVLQIVMTRNAKQNPRRNGLVMARGFRAIDEGWAPEIGQCLRPSRDLEELSYESLRRPLLDCLYSLER